MVDKNNNEFQDFDKYSSAIAHYTQKTVSRIINEWYLYTLKRKILLELENYIGKERKKKIQLRILREWFELSMKERLNLVKEEYILKRRNDHILKHLFSYWYTNHYLNIRNEYRTFCYLKKLYSTHLLEEIFKLWYLELMNNRKCQKFQKQIIQRKIFLVWYDEYYTIVNIRNELEICKKKRIFLGYLNFLKIKKNKKLYFNEKINFIEKSKLNRIFNNWVILVQYSMNKRYKILQWQINNINNQILQIIKAWKTVILKRKQEKYKFEIIKKNHQIHILHVLFNLWYILAQESSREKTMLIISGLSARRQLLMNGFFSFKYYLLYKRESKILKDKSKLYLVYYILLVFKRNGSNYSKQKIKLENAQNLFQTKKIKLYWEKWLNYLNNIKITKFKAQNIYHKYNQQILKKTLKIWNYVWFKTVTNKMIIECIQVKISMNIKRRVFYFMIYIIRIRKSQFWKAFQSLINAQLAHGFEKLRFNMIFQHNQEILENQLASKIRSRIIIKYWRALAIEKKKVNHIQSIIMIKHLFQFLKSYSNIIGNFEKIQNLLRNNIEFQVFQLWRINSRKRRNLENILKNKSIEKISKEIIISSYFNKWYQQFMKNKRISNFIHARQSILKMQFFLNWKNSAIKKFTLRKKYQQFSEKSLVEIFDKYFNIWINKYKKKSRICEILNNYLRIQENKKIYKTFQKMKQIANHRKRKRQTLIHILEQFQKIIISKAWIRIKEHYYIEKSVEIISIKYWNHIQNKRLKLIYDHWRFVADKIREIKKQENLSENYYQYKVINKIFNIWRISFQDELIRQADISRHIKANSEMILINQLRNIINIWKEMAFKQRNFKRNENLIKLLIKRRNFNLMIKVFNKINYYKKRVLDTIHFEFINSFIFKLQYYRVIEMNKQVTITLNISLEMYSSYCRLRKGMDLWLKSMILRIERKKLIRKEMKIMEFRIHYLRLRFSFHKLIEWKTIMRMKENEIERRIQLNFLNNIFQLLRNELKEAKFTIQLSELLYRNFMLRRILDGFNYWRNKSKYQKDRKLRGNLLLKCMNTRKLSKILINWRNYCEEYINYYKLIKSIQIPIKKRVLVVFKCNYMINKVTSNQLSFVFELWYSLTIKKGLLRNKLEDFTLNYKCKRLIERLFNEWRIQYYQKLRVYQFYHQIIIIKPKERILTFWYNRTIQRMNKENDIRKKVQFRIERNYFKWMIIIYKIHEINKELNKKVITRIFSFWRRIFKIEKLKRLQILKKCLKFWRNYSEKRISNQEKMNYLINNKSRILMEDYYHRFFELYIKRMEIKEKSSIIQLKRIFQDKKNSFMIWNNKFIYKRKIQEKYYNLVILHEKYILRLTIRIWKNRVLKEERYRQIIQEKDLIRIQVIKSKVFSVWRIIWRPCHYVNISKDLVKLLNQITLHNSFHKILRFTFYSYKYKKISKFEKLENIKQLNIGYSYYMECKCSENGLKRLIMELKSRSSNSKKSSIQTLANGNNERFDIIEILSKIEYIKNNTIYEMLLRMREYVRITSKYHKGIIEFENTLTRLILSRIWKIMMENITKAWILRNLTNIIRIRKEQRIKKEMLVRWVNNYNNCYKNKCIIEYMGLRYNHTIKIKCYLIWSIKFEIFKRKKILKEKSERFLGIYLLEYTLKRMNEYYLYNKWIIWCKKAYDTIEWVHDFRLKSLLFINWRRYSNRQKNLRDGLYLLYVKVKSRMIMEFLLIWKNRIRELLRIRKLAKDYYLNGIIYNKRFKEFFNLWKVLTLRKKNQRIRILEYMENKCKNLKMTCFKLWRFFIYYKRTRNSRFEKVTNIIRINHRNMTIYRIFYSWKLKMIELRSLKNSIISFWNSGNAIEMNDNKNLDRLLKEDNIISESSLNLAMKSEFSKDLLLEEGINVGSSSKEEEEEEEEESNRDDSRFMKIFSSSSNNSERIEEESNIEKRPLFDRGYSNKLLSSLLSSSSSSSESSQFQTQNQISVSKSPYNNKSRTKPKSKVMISPISQYTVSSSSDGELEIDELQSSLSSSKVINMSNKSQNNKLSPNLYHNSSSPYSDNTNYSPLPLNNKHSNNRNKSNLTIQNPQELQLQPQIYSSQDFNLNPPSPSSSSLSSSSYLKINENPNLIISNTGLNNQNIKDLPQDPYYISNSSPNHIYSTSTPTSTPTFHIKPNNQNIYLNHHIQPQINLFTSSSSSQSQSS